jgi:hypothetical protein
MKNLIGCLICLAGIAIGIYVGVWLMFILGIVQIIEAVKVTPVNAMGIALGIARVILSGFVGWLIGLGIFGLGVALLLYL